MAKLFPPLPPLPPIVPELPPFWSMVESDKGPALSAQPDGQAALDEVPLHLATPSSRQSQQPIRVVAVEPPPFASHAAGPSILERGHCPACSAWRPLPGFSIFAWALIKRGCAELLLDWGAELQRLGWATCEVWGCHPGAPGPAVHVYGLGLLVRDGAVVRVTADGCDHPDGWRGLAELSPGERISKRSRSGRLGLDFGPWIRAKPPRARAIVGFGGGISLMPRKCQPRLLACARGSITRDTSDPSGRVCAAPSHGPLGVS